MAAIPPAKLITFIIILQILVWLPFLDYVLRPIRVQVSCQLGTAQSISLQNQSIVDCTACYQPYRNFILPIHIKGFIRVSLPISSNHQIKIHSSLQFVAHVYSQSNCIDYECPQFSILDDFSYTQSQNRQKIIMYGLKKESEQFSFEQLPFPFNIYISLATSQDTTLYSNYLFTESPMSSFMVRFRYSTPSFIDSKEEPTVFFHGLEEHYLLRVGLTALVFLQVGGLLSFLHHYGQLTKSCIVIVLALGFINHQFALLSGSLALYLCVGHLSGDKRLCIASMLVFLTLGWYSLHIANISPLLMMNLILLASAWKQQKQDQYIQTLLRYFLLVNNFMGYVYSMPFLLLITPVHLLGGLLLCSEGRNSHKRDSIKDLIRLHQDQDEVLYGIDKQLGNPIK